MQQNTYTIEGTKTIIPGPFSLLKTITYSNSKIIVSSNDNHKFYGYLKGFDRHSNLFLEDVTEIWKEEIKVKNRKTKKTILKEKFIPKMFFRGDSIIMIAKLD